MMNARSVIIGHVQVKNSSVSEPTHIKVLGYVCDANGQVLNTRHHSLIKPKQTKKKEERSKLILTIGTSMNSGKSTNSQT